MASGEVSTSQPGKTLSTSGLLMKGWLDITTDCQSGTDKWNTTNLQRRYCKLQRLGDSLSLEVYSDEENTKPIHTLSLFKTPSKDTARNAARWCRGQVVTEDGTVLCVMEGDERVSEWVDSLNSVIKPATSDTDGKMKTEGDGVRHTADSPTHTAGTSDGEDHVPRQLSEEPEVIKEGWLNILTDPAPGEDKLYNMQTKYCSLQRQGDRYSFGERFDNDS
ncbi:uncharacterized protein, partial [Littorina saxatilis]|uniref:uncharacterized protein n=1 Tax=Littorina saxatilis TaxID=31220 RepID=UPI0038B64213